MLDNQPDPNLLSGGLPEEEPKVTVSASALRQVIEALVGPPQLIRELLVTRGLAGYTNPIDKLIDEFNAAVKRLHPNAPDEPTPEAPNSDAQQASSSDQPDSRTGDPAQVSEVKPS